MTFKICFFFFSSRRRHTRWNCDWSSDVCSSDLNNGFALLRLADIGETDIGGHARHAEDAKRGRDRRLGGIELQEAVARHRAVELPAIAAHCEVALAEAGVVRAHDLADDAALDHRAHFNGLD